MVIIFQNEKIQNQQYLHNLLDFHLDLEKHKDLAPDNSHAGAKSHKKLANMIMNKLS